MILSIKVTFELTKTLSYPVLITKTVHFLFPGQLGRRLGREIQDLMLVHLNGKHLHNKQVIFCLGKQQMAVQTQWDLIAWFWDNPRQELNKMNCKVKDAIIAKGTVKVLVEVYKKQNQESIVITIDTTLHYLRFWYLCKLTKNSRHFLCQELDF